MPSAVPEPLARHRVFRGCDLDEAREAVGRVFCSHSLSLRRRGERLNAVQYAAAVGDITISHVSYGAAVEIGAGDVDRFFCVQLPDAGRAEVASGDRRIVSTPARASVPTPSERLRMSWEADASHLIVKVDACVIERYLERLLGRTPGAPIRLTLGADAGRPEGARWRAVYELLLAELSALDAGADHRASTAAVQELVVTSFLLGQPNNYWDELRRPSPASGTSYVRRAMEHARAHLDGPLTVSELASTVGISVRSLQLGFRAATGTTPTTWIRNERLDRARADLAAAEPGDGSRVTDVALRYGFSHFGRFATLYHARFGERPSETLRR